MSLFPEFPEDENKPKTFQELWNTLDRNKTKFEFTRGHQTKLLEEIYQEFKKGNSKDFALSLPTGTGKTVIGLMLAYFTMLNEGVKSIYLCPNKFLCDQVLSEAKDLGTPAVGIYGNWNSLPESSTAPFLNGSAIGVATYSTIFNSAPKIGDVGLIIMDDVHASGDAIIANWSIRINNSDNPQLYQEVYGAVYPFLNKEQKTALDSKPGRAASHEMLYSKQWLNIVDSLIQIFDSHANDMELKYTWKWNHPKIENYVCLISYQTFEIRPITPPTSTVREFRDARFRVYMSATIDNTGNLENIVGIDKLRWVFDRDVDVPGNRLILNLNTLIPNVRDENRVTLIAEKVRRLIVLTQSKSQQADLRDALETAHYSGRIFTPTQSDISTELIGFKDSSKAVIILAGRYDGLDFGGKSADGVLIYRLPEAINEFEFFVTQKWQTRDEARARAIQRIHQGMGRCTRKDSDDVMIFLVGDELVKVLLDPNVLKSFPGRLRLELENCKQMNNPSTLDALLSEFSNGGEEWKRRKSDINKNAPKYPPLDPSDSRINDPKFLFSKFNDLLWDRNYDGAISLAANIAGNLSFKGSQADSSVWYYLAGLASDIKSFLFGVDPYKAQGHGYFNQAISNSRHRDWFGNLSGYETPIPIMVDLEYRVQRICSLLYGYPPENDSLNQYLTGAVQKLKGRTDQGVKEFLKIFGESLGFETLIPKRNGAPDCIWYLKSNVCFIFEAKLDKTNDTISLLESRQVTTQPAEVANNEELFVPNDLKITCLTDVSKIAKEATQSLKNFYVLNPACAESQATSWFDRLISSQKRAYKDRSYLGSQIQAALIGFGYDTNGTFKKINQHLAEEVLEPV